MSALTLDAAAGKQSAVAARARPWAARSGVGGSGVDASVSDRSIFSEGSLRLACRP